MQGSGQGQNTSSQFWLELSINIMFKAKACVYTRMQSALKKNQPLSLKT